MHSGDDLKRAAGFAAVDRYVEDGMCVGLGTGTTAYWAIERVGERVARGERIAAVATSRHTESLCAERDIPVLSLMDRNIAVAIDGADEVGSELTLIKGGGGALFREKAVALAADRFVVVVTDLKLVAVVGRFPLPVEVVPYAADYVAREIAQLGCHAVARRGGANPFVTDNENWILDCPFGRIDAPRELDARLRAINGVVASGLFVGLTSEVIVAGPGGIRTLAPAKA
jgi:ribose 5-phosphate isomerase A